MSSIFLVLQVPVTGAPDNLQIESQAHNGLRLWLQHFENVVAACPYALESVEPTLPVSTIPGGDRLRIIGLDQAWQPHHFFKKMPAVSKILADEIDKADYLQFGIGGLWGDWGSVAAWISNKKGRPFSVWTDHVESDVHFKRAQGKRVLPRLYTKATAAAMIPYERAVIARSALGLFHGADCYNAYARFCRNPHLVHDIHIGADQHITDEQLSSRLNGRAGGPLRVVYAGRAAPEKGALDWVKAIAHANSNGARIVGTWYGAGIDLPAAKELADSLSLPISFPGSILHEQLLQEMKRFDIFVFCHKTLESPRCLIEALACGLPIVGYDSPYPNDLTKKHGGSVLVQKGNIADLGEAIARFSRSDILPKLSFLAKQSAADLTDEAVFAHRSRLIKLLSTQSR
ncbi:glycosyltransferase [Bradyrhizobium sp. WSM3983]|uniref:glycosyltransferase n=1 Tax=Bradyrhizobium sp. WSM3983 TaxID=1038867 RepID=UPI0004116C53|nr:glycosyltransferase [Bradyrhizobium sp. WSM3983]